MSGRRGRRREWSARRDPSWRELVAPRLRERIVVALEERAEFERFVLQELDLKGQAPAPGHRILDRTLLHEFTLLTHGDHRLDRRIGGEVAELSAFEVDHQAPGAIGVAIAHARRCHAAGGSADRVVALKADLIRELD